LNSKDLKIVVVIPVYNHSKSLRSVVMQALEVHNNIIVVDDGSTDVVSDLLAGLSVRVIRHEKNRGKGVAIMTGAKEARRLGMTHIVTIDADGQHDPSDIRYFIPVIKRYPNAIVVGNRAFQSNNVPGKSRFGRVFSNFWMRLQTGQILKDTQSGFRAYPLAALNRLKLREHRFSFEVEVLVKAAWAGIGLREVDISVYYPSVKDRISHFNVFWDNLLISLLNFKLTMRSIAPIPHRKIVFDKQGGYIITVWHPVRSLKTLLTENTSPRKLGAAGFLGVFLGALPLIACHTVTIIFSASFFRFNKVVALSTSQLCMPPIVPALCIETWYFSRHGKFLTEISMETIGYQGLERFYEWFIGSLVVGPIMGALVGSIIYIIALFIMKGNRAINR